LQTQANPKKKKMLVRSKRQIVRSSSHQFAGEVLEDKIYSSKESSNHSENPPRHSSLQQPYKSRLFLVFRSNIFPDFLHVFLFNVP
jgi:hypothetical protein